MTQYQWYRPDSESILQCLRGRLPTLGTTSEEMNIMRENTLRWASRGPRPLSYSNYSAEFGAQQPVTVGCKQRRARVQRFSRVVTSQIAI